MRCPKCETGEITKIVMKGKDMAGFLCDGCGTVWFQDEDINEHTGHDVQSVGEQADQEYTLVDVSRPTQDTRPAAYPQFR